MTDRDLDQVLRQVLDGDVDPIAAADELRVQGHVMIGWVGADLGEARPEQTLRYQALMGRLLWLFLTEGGALTLSEPAGLEGYRDFFVTSVVEDNTILDDGGES